MLAFARVEGPSLVCAGLNSRHKRDQGRGAWFGTCRARAEGPNLAQMGLGWSQGCALNRVHMGLGLGR